MTHTHTHTLSHIASTIGNMFACALRQRCRAADPSQRPRRPAAGAAHPEYCTRPGGRAGRQRSKTCSHVQLALALSSHLKRNDTHTHCHTLRQRSKTCSHVQLALALSSHLKRNDTHTHCHTLRQRSKTCSHVQLAISPHLKRNDTHTLSHTASTIENMFACAVGTFFASEAQ